MINLRAIPAYLRHAHWYAGGDAAVPLTSNPDDWLPLPSLDGVAICWPQRYAWAPGAWRLDLIRRELAKLLPVTTGEVSCPERFRQHGGFPVPESELTRVGQPGRPKDRFDIRGELFEVHWGRQVIRCAYDYSDFAVVSRDVLREVDLYFKCVAPLENLAAKVVPVGYFPRRASLLAKARRRFLASASPKTIDVYARFGSWTDSQDARRNIVDRLRRSGLAFTGGFDMRIYPAYLRELLAARISVEAPGQGPLSYRLAESMALGAVVVCAQPRCTLPEGLRDGVHFLRMRHDASDLVKICGELLADKTRQRDIAERALSFFDRNFSPQSIARRILRACAGVVEERSGVLQADLVG